MKRLIFPISALMLTLAARAPGQLQPRTTPAAEKPEEEASPAPDVPEVEPVLPAELSAKLLKQLAEVENGLSGKRGGESAALIKKLKEASASNEKAYNLWESCKKEIDFEQKGKTATDFVNWKKKEGRDLSANDGFCASLRLQAQFLALAIMDSHADTPARKSGVMTEANLYLEALSKACDKEEGLAKNILSSIMDVGLDPNQAVTAGDLEETLKQVREAGGALGGDIMESMYSKSLKAMGVTGKEPSQAKHPGNIDEIYESLVLTTLRKKKDMTGVAAAWTRRISQTAGIAKSTKVKELSERFEAEKLPVLKWKQARDQWRTGQMEAGAAAMLAVIRANPSHKECQNWVAELRTLAEAK